VESWCHKQRQSSGWTSPGTQGFCLVKGRQQVGSCAWQSWAACLISRWIWDVYLWRFAPHSHSVRSPSNISAPICHYVEYAVCWPSALLKACRIKSQARTSLLRWCEAWTRRLLVATWLGRRYLAVWKVRFLLLVWGRWGRERSLSIVFRLGFTGKFWRFIELGCCWCRELGHTSFWYQW